MSKPTKVTLLSWTRNPLETIYCEWQMSRTTGEIQTPDQLKERITDEIERHTIAGDIDGVSQTPLEKEIEEVAEKVIAMKMPLGEHIQFVFALEHCPISLREQIVRHRIGHKFGEQLGCDTVPDLAGTSSFWSQTTRIINMGNFATEGEYRTPSWIEEHKDEKLENNGGVSIGYYWHYVMAKIELSYQMLTRAGMPLEDARDILPLGLQHRFTWSTNLAAIMHVLSRRGCWLAQLGMWEPVITGIVEELATKVHPTFRRLIDPPCFDYFGNYNKCVFGKENEEVIANGKYPPCSLWVNKEAPSFKGNHETCLDDFVSEEQRPRYEAMQIKYEKLWRRDSKTGERKAVG